MGLAGLREAPARLSAFRVAGAAKAAWLAQSRECPGLELRHEGDPTTCVTEWGGCNVCGVH